MAKGDDIQKRLIRFAVEMIRLSSALPKTQAGRHIGKQLLRSGTAAAPNYAEARSAESRRDFIHKLRIALKELNETEIWLAILRESEMLSAESVQPHQHECEALCKIISTSIQTTLKHQPRRVSAASG